MSRRSAVDIATVTVEPFGNRHHEACLAIFESNVPRYFRPHERQEFESFLASLPGPYLVLVSPTGTALACGGYAVDDTGAADLCWGMVRREEHGRGLGRALTQMRIAELTKDDRVRSIALQTSQHTSEFYERLGFLTMRIVENGYAPGLDRHDMMLEVQR